MIKQKNYCWNEPAFYFIKTKEIEQNKFEYFEDTKSKKGEILKKNLFSGNTLFFKQDYLDCGGMDESFIGYGFADNDMTLNVISKGYRAIWLKDLEVHLHHNIEFLYENKIINEEVEFKKVSRANLNKFIVMWNYKNISNFIKIRWKIL